MQEPVLVIAGEEEFEEEYLAELIDAAVRGHDPPPDPIVRILRVLRYPAQRAIVWQDVANEVPPLREGCVCRLPVLRLSHGEEGLYSDYPSSLRAALERALIAARSDGERAILLRHQAEGTRKKRIVISR